MSVATARSVVAPPAAEFRVPSSEMAASAGKRPRVVIVGAGFGGLAAAKALKDAPST